MNIFLDIETIPCQLEGVRQKFIDEIQAPCQYKKPESIAEWIKENAESAGDEAWRKTSFDGAMGHVIVIGMKVNDLNMVFMQPHENEKEMLMNFYKNLDEYCNQYPNQRPVFVGHNLIDFDLRFLFQRSVVLGVKPSKYLPFNCKPWDESVYDTMQKWGARAGGSLDRITKACGLSGKGDIDGSMVYDYYAAGKLSEIAAYCMEDVKLTEELFNRMTFNF